MRPEAVSAVAVLAVVTVAAAVVAALPQLVTIPGTVVIAADTLPSACLAVVFGMGVALQSYLLPPRRR